MQAYQVSTQKEPQNKNSLPRKKLRQFPHRRSCLYSVKSAFPITKCLFCHCGPGSLNSDWPRVFRVKQTC